MTLRMRALLSVTAALLAAMGFMVGAFLTPNHLLSALFGVLAFLFLIPANMWLRTRFRCPVCETSVFDTRGPFTTFWPSRNCARCGTDLRKRSAGKNGYHP